MSQGSQQIYFVRVVEDISCEVIGCKESNGSNDYALFSVRNIDQYETVQLPERKMVTFGVDLKKLEEWR